LDTSKRKNKDISNAEIVGTISPGTDIVSNATTLLDGTIIECISAANNIQDSWGITILLTGTGTAATASETCVDILIGGATDDVLISALICGYTTRTSGWRQYFFPLHIPQGKRIAALSAGVQTSKTMHVVIYLHGGGVPPFRVGKKVDTLGTQINNARGQAITPAQSGAAASVTEMIASTTVDYYAFLPGFQVATDTDVTNAGMMNIGIGVGASTEDRIGTWWFDRNTNESMNGPVPPIPAFHDVPAGSRITMLASNSTTNDAAYDGLIYAVS
jgi:hypothetical protein